MKGWAVADKKNMRVLHDGTDHGLHIVVSSLKMLCGAKKSFQVF
jgi:hypothetical protein